MHANILAKYLKKVKQFAWEKGPSPLYSNVLIKGLGKNLLLACTDASMGIQQIIAQTGALVECECCVNVFEFANIIDKLDSSLDLQISLKGRRLHIVTDNFQFSLKAMDADQIFNIPVCNEWLSLDKQFLTELGCVLPPNDELDAPIIYDCKKIFLGNPKALYYMYTDKCPTMFSADQKYVKKISVDAFTKMCITDNSRLNLKNEMCQIFIPTFNGNSSNIAVCCDSSFGSTSTIIIAYSKTRIFFALNLQSKTCIRNCYRCRSYCGC